jgi:hypothetical protein
MPFLFKARRLRVPIQWMASIQPILVLRLLRRLKLATRETLLGMPSALYQVRPLNQAPADRRSFPLVTRLSRFGPGSGY